jgi:hypothetical protein
MVMIMMMMMMMTMTMMKKKNNEAYYMENDRNFCLRKFQVSAGPYGKWRSEARRGKVR